jgi:hypothetical protein
MIEHLLAFMGAFAIALGVAVWLARRFDRRRNERLRADFDRYLVDQGWEPSDHV